jgi:hypothetical protein
MVTVVSLSDVREAHAVRRRAALIHRLRAAMDQVQALAQQAYPDIERWVSDTEEVDEMPVRLIAIRAPHPCEWDGPGLYEFRLLDDSARGFKSQPIAFLDRAPERDKPRAGVRFYRWTRKLKGKSQGRPSFVSERRLLIIRKLADR